MKNRRQIKGKGTIKARTKVNQLTVQQKVMPRSCLVGNSEMFDLLVVEKLY